MDTSLYSLVPLFFLFALFMVGFYFAWTDFRPRRIRINENEDFSVSTFSSIGPAVKRKELTMRELGIDELGNKANLPYEVQKSQKIDETVRNYSVESPELAANIVKNWLKE